ncbi:hypothetical protein HZA99_02660 [Candidatus Woesearchaeota archaeon]|nr:hypothetical protein [Candidatus Woesearchaeota archaeon]
MVRNIHENSSLDSFISALEACRPTFSSISFPEHLQPRRDSTHLRGAIAEKYVELWLQSCPGFSFRHNPRSVNGYTFQKKGRTLLVSEQEKEIIEYDLAGTYNDTPILAEVKADHARGFMNRVPFALATAQALYARPPALLLFVPYPIDSRENDTVTRLIEQQNSMFRRICMNYSSQELRQAVSSFSRDRGSAEARYMRLS